ncbi:uncharacterized protein LOC131880699 [Tigriopus californicus]|uniref:uncharacterized protein LOC131880699 n=1 Tax=Tigriopus californicus TaxID=6832 RepID=UPI0027DA4C19|nr:uncharacterized protein LOC131880699 [Tigriopus californicus]
MADIAAASVKLPPLSESFVDIWFARAEAMFVKACIKLQDTKFAHFISILSDDQMVKVHKAITEPRAGHEYDDLKEALKNKLKRSSFRNVQRLITDEQLGAQLPSELLCYCEMLIQPNDRGTDLFKQIFLMKLPPTLYGQLSADLSLKLSNIVVKADKIVIGSRGMAGSYGNSGTMAAVGLSTPDPVEALSGKLDLVLEAFNVKHSKPGRVGQPDQAFVINSCASVSVCPRQSADTHDPHLNLIVANGTLIKTYGKQRMIIDHSGKKCAWSFILADVKCNYIGRNFLAFYNFLIDMAKREIRESSSATLRLQGIQDASTFEDTARSAILTPPTSSNNLLVKHILVQYPNVIQEQSDCLPTICHHVTHAIETFSDRPIPEKPRRLSPEKRKALWDILDSLLQAGLIRPSRNPCAAPGHVVQKPNGGWRLVGDYRALNAETTPDAYSLPHLHDFTYGMGDSKIFSKLDLVSAYHQVPMKQSDFEKTTITPCFGLYKYVQMPFGLRNAGQTFQRMDNEIFRDMPFVFIYVDDLIIASSSTEEHLRHVKLVLTRLHEHGLIHPHLRGHCDDSIDSMITPKDSQLVWSHEADQAFEDLKLALANASHLIYPIENATTRIVCDASKFAIGAVLEQKVEHGWRLISFFSKKLSSFECRYSTYDRELLAMYLAVRHFKHFVEGTIFHILTDQKPLQKAIKSISSTQTETQARRLAYIALLTSDVQYIEGEENVVADSLSRAPALDALTISDPLLLRVSMAQANDPGLAHMAQNSDRHKTLKIKGVNILCDCQGAQSRALVPSAEITNVMTALHHLGHP